MALCRGDTYLDDGSACPTGDRHLWVVCSDCKGSSVVVVSITTFRNERQDKTCHVDVGDHPFVTHTSIVLYHAAEVRSATELARSQASRTIRVRERMPPHVLDSIVRGFVDSPHSPPECVAILEDQGYV
ncbi:MAG: hypothetical protein K8T90_09970 [Planctomycetes bacterium]|nr:hypothetical protein [Planctomycetota bacterium]